MADFTTMDNQHLTACLILYQQRRDQALGINWQSAALRGLLWYYGKLQERQATQTARFVLATLLNKIIQEGASTIKVLMGQADTSDDKHAIARQVVAIGEQIDLAKKVLDELTNDTQEIDTESGSAAAAGIERT